MYQENRPNMNSFFKQFSCFSFIVIFCTYSQIEARDSKLFSKYVHVNQNNNNYVTVHSTVQRSVPTPAPAPTPLGSEIGDVPVPAPVPVESENAYYGLYGKGGSSDHFPFETTPTTSTTTTMEGVDDEFSTEEFKMENSNELNSRESNNYNNNLYSDNYNNNMNNGYFKSNSKVYTIEPQGMSDTRSLENKKYYHDIKNENYNPNTGYEPVKENSNEEGYYNKSAYEFDSMEEYERKEGYPDVQRVQYINP